MNGKYPGPWFWDRIGGRKCAVFCNTVPEAKELLRGIDEDLAEEICEAVNEKWRREALARWEKKHGLPHGDGAVRTATEERR